MGILVADIFLGEFPREVQAVLRLPSVIHLPIQGQVTLSDEAEQPHPSEELQFRSPETASLPRLPSRAVLIRELDAFLGAEAERARSLVTRAVVLRASALAKLRASHRLSHHFASTMHERTRLGFVRRGEAPLRRLTGAGQTGVQRSRKPSLRAPKSALSTGKQTAALESPWASHAKQRVSVGARPRRDRQVARSRPRVRPWRVRWRTGLGEPLRVGVSALVFGGFIATLASLGDLPRVARQTEAIAQRGTEALTSGVRSLLAADTRAGASEFADALSTFQEALRQLNDSTTLLQRIAAGLDPDARLTSAQALLALGERAAALGTDATKVVELFQDSSKGSLTGTLEAILPRLTRLEEGLSALLKDLDALNLAALPEDAAQTVGALNGSLHVLQRGIRGFIASQAVVLELLGGRHDRQYLVMFQNNRELRPTGGFIGSFALVDVSRGEVRKVQVDTIYNPDGQLKDFLVPPAPLQKITDRWFARDANWFADFRASASKVAHFFERSTGPTVDGVLAVTPDLLEDLLRLTGPIPMPDYGVTVTAENVTRETQRLVTYEYDRERNEPKAFIADLVPEVFGRVTTLPKERWGEMMGTFVTAFAKKHLLVYLRNEEAEAAVVRLGWGGTLPVLPPAAATALTDHLGRVEANVGGHKTDGLIEQTVDHEVTFTKQGAVDVTLVVTRHHRGSKAGSVGVPPDEDPERKPNIVYERTFVAHGSELLEARGFTRESDVPFVFANTADYGSFRMDEDVHALEADSRVHESGVRLGTESGFTTVGGWIVTEPEETTVTVLRYRLPFRLPRPSLLPSILRYELLLTHQPGHLPVLTRSSLRVPEGFRISWAGPASAVTLAGEQRAAHSALVDRDLTWGAVLEEK